MNKGPTVGVTQKETICNSLKWSSSVAISLVQYVMMMRHGLQDIATVLNKMLTSVRSGCNVNEDELDYVNRLVNLLISESVKSTEGDNTNAFLRDVLTKLRIARSTGSRPEGAPCEPICVEPNKPVPDNMTERVSTHFKDLLRRNNHLTEAINEMLNLYIDPDIVPRLEIHCKYMRNEKEVTIPCLEELFSKALYDVKKEHSS